MFESSEISTITLEIELYLRIRKYTLIYLLISLTDIKVLPTTFSRLCECGQVCKRTVTELLGAATAEEIFMRLERTGHQLATSEARPSQN